MTCIHLKSLVWLDQDLKRRVRIRWYMNTHLLIRSGLLSQLTLLWWASSVSNWHLGWLCRCSILSPVLSHPNFHCIYWYMATQVNYIFLVFMTRPAYALPQTWLQNMWCLIEERVCIWCLTQTSIITSPVPWHLYRRAYTGWLPIISMIEWDIAALCDIVSYSSSTITQPVGLQVFPQTLTAMKHVLLVVGVLSQYLVTDHNWWLYIAATSTVISRYRLVRILCT